MKLLRLGLWVCFVSVFVVILPEARAAGPNATITWGAGYPLTAAGQVSGMGDYGIIANYTLVSITMTAVPQNGGALPNPVAGNSNVSMGGCGQATQGQWGGGGVNNPLVMKLPTGQYTLYVTIKVKDACNNMTSWSSPVNIINVP